MAMKGQEHYHQAEKLLERAKDERQSDAERQRCLAEAQVHATLALVAINATSHGGLSEKSLDDWKSYGLRA